MDPNDGSQGQYQGGYQGGCNPLMYSYQGQQYWPMMQQLPQGMMQMPQGRAQLPQGRPPLAPNFSMMHPSTAGPQLFQPAEMENASLQPNQDDVDDLSVSAAPSASGKRSSAVTRIKLSNFSPHEDVFLVKSWLEIQGDPITNTSKKKDKSWLRILERYNLRRKTYPERTWKSLQCCWDIIKAECSKFASYYAEVIQENRSGTSEADQTTQAAANFSDILKKQFSYLHCWELLKDEPKWLDAIKSSEGLGEDNINLGDGSSSPSRAAEKRPMGRDQAKAAKKSANESGGSTSSSEYASRMEDLSLQRNGIMQQEAARRNERFEMMERIEEQRLQEMRSHNAAQIAIQQAKIEFKHERYAKEQEEKNMQEDERILSIDIEKVHPASLRAYYQERQADILEKMKARRSKRRNPEP